MFENLLHTDESALVDNGIVEAVSELAIEYDIIRRGPPLGLADREEHSVSREYPPMSLLREQERSRLGSVIGQTVLVELLDPATKITLYRLSGLITGPRVFEPMSTWRDHRRVVGDVHRLVVEDGALWLRHPRFGRRTLDRLARVPLLADDLSPASRVLTFPATASGI